MKETADDMGRDKAPQADEQVPEVEVDLGNYSITCKNGASSLRIDMTPAGTVLQEDKTGFEGPFQEKPNRFSQIVNVEVRNSEPVDITDPKLGLIRRRILEKSNALFDRHILRDIVVRNFLTCEQVPLGTRGRLGNGVPMADDEQIGQDEIEELLRSAQSGSDESPPPAAAKAPGESQSLGQGDIEALLNSAGGGDPAHAAAAAAKTATAAAPVRQEEHTKGVGGDDIELLLSQAEQAIASVDDPVAVELQGIAPFELKDFGGTPASADKATLELLRDVELDLKIELGRTHMYLEDVLKLRKGSVVPLDKLAGDPVDIYVNGRLIAQGEVLVLNDNFCVRVAELISGGDAD